MTNLYGVAAHFPWQLGSRFLTQVLYWGFACAPLVASRPYRLLDLKTPGLPRPSAHLFCLLKFVSKENLACASNRYWSDHILELTEGQLCSTKALLKLIPLVLVTHEWNPVGLAATPHSQGSL